MIRLSCLGPRLGQPFWPRQLWWCVSRNTLYQNTSAAQTRCLKLSRSQAGSDSSGTFHFSKHKIVTRSTTNRRPYTRHISHAISRHDCQASPRTQLQDFKTEWDTLYWTVLQPSPYLAKRAQSVRRVSHRSHEPWDWASAPSHPEECLCKDATVTFSSCGFQEGSMSSSPGLPCLAARRPLPCKKTRLIPTTSKEYQISAFSWKTMFWIGTLFFGKKDVFSGLVLFGVLICFDQSWDFLKYSSCVNHPASGDQRFFQAATNQWEMQLRLPWTVVSAPGLRLWRLGKTWICFVWILSS